MRKKWISKMIILIIVCSLAGCGTVRESLKESVRNLLENETTAVEENEEISEDFRAVIDHLSQVFLAFDEDEQLYAQLLDTVNDYIEGKLSQENVVEELKKVFNVYDQKVNTIRELPVDDDFSKKLSAYGISAEAYKELGNTRKNEITNFIYNITIISIYMGYFDELQTLYGDLNSIYLLCMEQQNVFREFRYYSLNAWFVDASEAEKDYLHEQVISKAEAYFPANPIWYENPKEALEKIESCLDELKEIMEERDKHMDGILEKEEK